MLSFLIGCIVGGMIGFFTVCILQINKNEDKEV